MSSYAKHFFAKNVAVPAGTGSAVTTWTPMADPSGPPVIVTGWFSRITASNFNPVVRSTDGENEEVGLLTLTAGFAVPIRLENVDLRTVFVGSRGSAGGTFTFIGSRT